MAAKAAPVTVTAGIAPFPASASLASRAVLDGSSITTFVMASVRSLHVRPILKAVSTLSPVSTQTRIPAVCICLMVSGTASCSRSSMAVAPTRFSGPDSSSSEINSDTRWLRVSDIKAWASTYLLCHDSYSSWSRSREAKQRVRKPWQASCQRWCSHTLESFTCGKTEVSAPFNRTEICPLGSRTTTDILFRSLSNSKMSKISTHTLCVLTGQPTAVSSAACSESLCTSISAPSRVNRTNSRPRARAALTRANSSGDEAWYVDLPNLSGVKDETLFPSPTLPSTV
mmetsp:Transcript_26807/g.70463  ORF Transcript_26807/g.70463 Transcript_26807/m.70463 type:complete len:285 (+) Transcript_26807:1395-2249(+)